MHKFLPKTKNTTNIVLIALICYFVFHLIYGERGVISYFKLQAELENKHNKLAVLRGKRIEIENNTKLLRNESMDQDMLDEKIRNTLGLSDPNERVIKLEEN